MRNSLWMRVFKMSQKSQLKCQRDNQEQEGLYQFMEIVLQINNLMMEIFKRERFKVYLNQRLISGQRTYICLQRDLIREQFRMTPINQIRSYFQIFSLKDVSFKIFDSIIFSFTYERCPSYGNQTNYCTKSSNIYSKPDKKFCQ